MRGDMSTKNPAHLALVSAIHRKLAHGQGGRWNPGRHPCGGAGLKLVLEAAVPILWAFPGFHGLDNGWSAILRLAQCPEAVE